MRLKNALVLTMRSDERENFRLVSPMMAVIYDSREIENSSKEKDHVSIASKYSPAATVPPMPSSWMWEAQAPRAKLQRVECGGNLTAFVVRE